MGLKRSLQSAATKVTVRVKESGVGRRFSRPGASSLGARGIEWVYLLVVFLLAGGLINAISNASAAGINNVPIVASASAQNVTETFIILFTYIMGSLGTYALYLCGRQTIRARSAEMYFIAGLGLISVAMTMGYYVLSLK
jgi:hypothetical protein